MIPSISLQLVIAHYHIVAANREYDICFWDGLVMGVAFNRQTIAGLIQVLTLISFD